MSDRRRGRRDPVADARRAGAADRNEALYAIKRARKARERAKAERRAFDPSPPADDEWTVADQTTDGVHRISAPTPVAETLGALARRQGWHERLRGAEAWSSWSRIVGDDLAARCEPLRLKGTILVIRAESQVWATQLRYLSSQLKANADAALGAGSVREIRIVVGPLEGRTRPETD